MEKKLYLYETHMHTSQASACAVSTGAQMARAYKAAGYTGIFVTDHFLNGNTAVPNYLPWKERIEAFCRGYEDAYEEGQKIGLQVFFGWESNFDGQEFLIYGLDKNWLIAHPEILNATPKQQYAMVKADGGMVIQAHPFREDWYIKEVRLYMEDVDGIEVYNIGNEKRNPICNDKAYYCSMRMNLRATCGSDAHSTDSEFGGMGFTRKLENDQDFIRAIMNREECKLFRRTVSKEEVQLHATEEQKREWNEMWKEMS